MLVPQRRRRCTPRRPHSAHVARASRPSLHVTVSAVEGGSTSRIALQVRRWRCGLRVLGSCLSCRSRGSVCLVLLLYLLLDAHRIGPRSRKAYLRQRRNSAGTVPAAPGGPFDGSHATRVGQSGEDRGDARVATAIPGAFVPARETDSSCGGRTPHTSLYHTAIGSERYSERSSKRVAGESGAPSSGALLELSNGSQGT